MSQRKPKPSSKVFYDGADFDVGGQKTISTQQSERWSSEVNEKMIVHSHWERWSFLVRSTELQEQVDSVRLDTRRALPDA